MNLYIYKYNNYYNRIVKYEDTLEGYGAYIHVLANCKDFSPNDGVNTQHTFGSAANNYNGSGDYAIVTDENNNILSRWFIIETHFTRAGQWSLMLRRDLVVDYLNDIVNADCFIEKATLPMDNPLIYNKEDFNVNQIKSAEYLLKDRSWCPWLVGYYDKKKESISGTVLANTSTNAISINANTIEEWEFYQYRINQAIGPESSGFFEFGADFFTLGHIAPYKARFKTNKKNGDTSHIEQLLVTNDLYQIRNTGLNLINQELKTSYIDFGLGNLNTDSYTGVLPQTTIDELLSYGGNTVVTQLGKYYEITVSDVPKTTTISIPSGALFNNLGTIARNAGYLGEPTESTFTYTYTSICYNISVKPLDSLSTAYTIPSNRLKTLDAAYDMFAIPYGEIEIQDDNGNVLLTTNKDISMAVARSLQLTLQSACYDIQLLPYCPIQELITASRANAITVSDATQYSFIVDNSTNPATNVGIIFNVPKANFSFNIYDIFIPSAESAIGKKINNECDKWRLTSPNYSNYFDFSVEKNNGVPFWEVDCSYKPYSPYIHICPCFSNLYGRDFNDVRGLICGGDFSLTQVTDAWIQYELQNKNYQATFDRQIQNMEVQHRAGRIQDIAGGITGTITGVTSGALAGSMIPGIGTVAGLIGGGIASLGGAIGDYAVNEMLRAEAIDYTKDMFGYQLGNIQALPNTISKISAFNNNNKLFPVLELYTCTDVEKTALTNKIAYNGMTVMTIGKIIDYMYNSWELNGITSKGYIKGQIIRLEGLEDEFHLLKEISNEIYKGVYF